MERQTFFAVWMLGWFIILAVVAAIILTEVL
jgi:hypothetical protein